MTSTQEAVHGRRSPVGGALASTRGDQIRTERLSVRRRRLQRGQLARLAPGDEHDDIVAVRGAGVRRRQRLKPLLDLLSRSERGVHAANYARPPGALST